MRRTLNIVCTAAVSLTSALVGARWHAGIEVVKATVDVEGLVGGNW